MKSSDPRNVTHFIDTQKKSKKLKRRPARSMTVLEARRMFLSEVEEFFAEEYGSTMMHTQINLEDADVAFAEFVGLKREREEQLSKISNSHIRIDKGRGHYKGHIGVDAKCERCKQRRDWHNQPEEECSHDA
jgi:hypothetical protein